MNTSTVPVPTTLPVPGEQRVPRPLTAKEQAEVERRKEAQRAVVAKKLPGLAKRFGPNHGVRRTNVVVAIRDNNGFSGERKPGQVPSDAALRTMKAGWAKWGQNPNPQGPPANMTPRGVAVAGSSGDSNSSGGGN